LPGVAAKPIGAADLRAWVPADDWADAAGVVAVPDVGVLVDAGVVLLDVVLEVVLDVGLVVLDVGLVGGPDDDTMGCSVTGISADDGPSPAVLTAVTLK
jgi:hypothetical protein